MPFAPSETWELDNIFSGGPDGTAFNDEIQRLDAEVRALIVRADAVSDPIDLAVFVQLLLDLEGLVPALSEIAAFAACEAAAHATSEAAMRAEALSSDLWNLYSRAWVVPAHRIAFSDEATFAALLAHPSIPHMKGALKERRDNRRFRLSEKEDALATELQADAILAWGQYYDAESGALRIPFDRGNGVEQLSPGQVQNLMYSDDGALRMRAFEAYTGAWRSIGAECARALTHITGFRQVLNDRRKLDPLEEPLAGAHIERSTLEAMLEAARRAGPMLQQYLRAKAKVMGKERLHWVDTLALVGTSGGAVSYGDAQDFIIEQFDVFSGHMSGFAKNALVNRWIEVEDRPGKRGGGFCTEIPLRKESRIFMTWGGSSRAVATLAHELGHAYHNEVLADLKPSQQRVPMTLAETASVFAETLVREASLARATDPGERLRLLDDSLSSTFAFLANIPARFEMERRLYELRRQGPLSASQLSAECRGIFARWYGDAVEVVDDTFWSNKLHFFIPTLAFYNFPYTFGYLFSALVYEHFRPMGPAGAPGYAKLLRRTGDEPAEVIAKEELGLDLGDPETWMKAMGSARRDLAAFLELVHGN